MMFFVLRASAFEFKTVALPNRPSLEVTTGIMAFDKP
jgi:hypothetical protein